jgi:O6-methylguanine-DNA--protein-cysteine methyltransferase
MSKRRNAENDNADAALGFSKKANTSGKQATLSFALRPNQAGRLPSPPASEDEKRDLSPTIRKVKSHQALTPYRKRIYGALLSVPKGRYTTYAALSDFLGSSARAVGGGIRNNPFAPEVPVTASSPVTAALADLAAAGELMVKMLARSMNY